MKLAIKSVIRTTYDQFECFEDQQLLYRAGNTLCLKTINKFDSEFICLDKNITKLFTYKPFTNKKGVFAAQKIGKDIYISSYSLRSQRKAIQLSEQANFISEVQNMELLSDQYDNTLVYGAARAKDIVCVFLADFSKMRVLGVGYLPVFDDIKVDGRENMRLSVCGHNGSYNYLKTLQYISGQWQITEQPLKKIQQTIFQHELLFGSRIILVTSNIIYILEDNQIVKSINIEQGSTIREIIKIPKGLLLRLQNDVLKLMVQDNDQVSYLMSSTLNLHLETNDCISAIRVSQNSQEVWIQSKRKNYYVWRCDNIGLQLSSLDLVFNKVETSSSNEDKEGNISISTGKKYALLTGSNSITLWSLQRNQAVLSSDFLDPNDPTKRTLFAGAINPDGNSLILAFQDKIRIYQILFTKFKQTNEFMIKRCQNIIYSHGGQLVACRFGRGANSSIVVLNLLRFSEVCTFKIQSQPHQILWNELDDQLIISVQNGAIQSYRIADQSRIYNLKLNGTIIRTRLDHKTSKFIVSTDKQIYLIQNGNIVEKLPHPFPDFSYVFPIYGSYLVVGKKGSLYICQSLKLQFSHQISLFSQKSFNIICRSGFLLAFSSFQDITTLKCIRSAEKKKDVSQQIVMIEKDEILNLFEKVKIIQSNYDILTAATNIKLEQERQNYQNAIQKIKNQYVQELAFANTKLSEISVQKLKQEKESQRIFEDIEIGQNRNVNQLQRMYQRKIEFQRQKFMNLQQRFLQYKIESERRVLQLEAKLSRDVNLIRNQYSKRAKEDSELVYRQKLRHLQDKKRIEYKILELQEENEVVLTDLQKSKDLIIAQLRMELKHLQESNQKNLALLQTQNKDLRLYKDKDQLTNKELRTVSQSLEESENRVNLLEREIERRNKMIDQRDQLIIQQSQQIGGLQKAKYVLSFRTTQIRKELQPKQSLIDKLKSELFKLDQQFKVEKKRNFELNQKLEKIEAVNIFSKRQMSDLRISLKCKQRAHDELCSQIFMVINTVDPKDWNGQFIKIYQNHIKEDKHKNRRDKKKDDTVQQITRHLVHVEQSLVQVTAGTDRLLKGKDKEVVRKMKQNSDLVYELNVMRKKQNEFQKEKKELINQNAKLKKEAEDSVKTTTRAHTANTGFTRRVIASREINSRDKNATLDLSELNVSKRDIFKQSKKQKSRLTSARRTLMVQDEHKQKNSKFLDLAKQLQTARNTIKRQDRMIQQLNHRLLGGPQLQHSGEQ